MRNWISGGIGMALVVFASGYPHIARAASNTPTLGGASGYSCSTEQFAGDHIPGRSCICEGNKDSTDCKAMLKEACQGQITVCAGKQGGPVTACECKWKTQRTDRRLKLTPLLTPPAVVKKN